MIGPELSYRVCDCPELSHCVCAGSELSYRVCVGPKLSYRVCAGQELSYRVCVGPELSHCVCAGPELSNSVGSVGPRPKSAVGQTVALQTVVSVRSPHIDSWQIEPVDPISIMDGPICLKWTLQGVTPW